MDYSIFSWFKKENLESLEHKISENDQIIIDKLIVKLVDQKLNDFKEQEKSLYDNNQILVKNFKIMEENLKILNSNNKELSDSNIKLNKIVNDLFEEKTVIIEKSAKLTSSLAFFKDESIRANRRILELEAERADIRSENMLLEGQLINAKVQAEKYLEHMRSEKVRKEEKKKQKMELKLKEEKKKMKTEKTEEEKI